VLLIRTGDVLVFLRHVLIRTDGVLVFLCHVFIRTGDVLVFLCDVSACLGVFVRVWLLGVFVGDASVLVHFFVDILLVKEVESRWRKYADWDRGLVHDLKKKTNLKI
jgi:hypothetical protein